MTDRELLELAAKAAGHRLEWHIPYAGSDEPHIEGMDWNPLDDDGDAFRLAVKLRLHSALETARRSVDYEKDTCAATRRAITRAAAEIGKEMT